MSCTSCLFTCGLYRVCPPLYAFSVLERAQPAEQQLGRPREQHGLWHLFWALKDQVCQCRTRHHVRTALFGCVSERALRRRINVAIFNVFMLAAVVVLLCGVVWCDVVWCDVMWCDGRPSINDGMDLVIIGVLEVAIYPIYRRLTGLLLRSYQPDVEWVDADWCWCLRSNLILLRVIRYFYSLFLLMVSPHA